MGGWWLVCSQKNFVPSWNCPCNVSPRRGLKGLSWLVHMYIELNTKAITYFKRSRGSLVLAACFKNWGANVHKSTILWIDDLASKILIGREICAIPYPLKANEIAYLATWDKIPFYLFSASSFVQISPPYAGFVKLFNIVGASVGNFSSKFYLM